MSKSLANSIPLVAVVKKNIGEVRQEERDQTDLPFLFRIFGRRRGTVHRYFSYRGNGSNSFVPHRFLCLEWAMFRVPSLSRTGARA